MIRNRWIASLAVVTVLGMLTPALPARAQDEAAPKALALGSALPMTTTAMKNIDGKSVTLAAAAGKRGTLVMFICNHCPFVKAWQGRIAAVNSNAPGQYPEDAYDVMKQRAKQVGYKFAYVVDATSDVARAFGASHTPEVFLFDAKGKLVYHGAVDDNGHDPKAVEHRWLQDAIDAVVTGGTIADAETKAIGCGIKYREVAAR